jgi:hypothetical protein
MKKILGLMVVAAALASCSVLDQKVAIQDGSVGKDNPLGLKGKVVTVSLLNNAVRPQGVNTATPIVSDPFADYTIPAIPSPAVLKGLVFELALAPSYNDDKGNAVPVVATISGDNKLCPATFDLTAIGGSVQLFDGSDTTGVTVPVVADPTKMTFTQTSTPCSYTFTKSLLSVNISGDPFTKIKAILTNGNNANQVKLTLNYTSDSSVKGTLGLVVGGGAAYAIGGI